jgi:hypothetical protein
LGIQAAALDLLSLPRDLHTNSQTSSAAIGQKIAADTSQPDLEPASPAAPLYTTRHRAAFAR